MANQATYNIGVRYNVDQSGLKVLQNSLKTLMNSSAVDLKLNTATAEQDLKKIRSAAGELDKLLSKSFNKDLGTINITKFNNALKNSHTDLQKIQSDLALAGNQGTATFRNFASQVLTTNLQLKETHKWLDSMSRTMINTMKWTAASAVMNSFTGAIQEAYGYVKNLDSSLNDIRIVTGKSSDEMARFAQEANKAAKGLGAATTDYTKASLIYYQQGLSDDEVKARANTTLKAANVTGQSTSEVSEQLTAVWNGYKVSANEAEKYVDKLAAVAATTASDLEELSTGMSKVASAANSMGVDVDQLNAQIATIISVTRQAPESVGTALKTIYARLGDLKVDGVDEFGTKLGEVSSQMKQMGIEVTDEMGNLRDIGTVIEETAAKWDTWTKAQKQAAAVAMAGKRQYNNLVALFDNWDMYTESLKTSQTALGTLQRQQDIYMDSMEAHLQQLETAKEGVMDSLFDTKGFKDLVDVGTAVLDLTEKIIDGLGGIGPILTGLSALVLDKFSNVIGGELSKFIINIKNGKENLQQLNAEAQLIKEFGVINLKDNNTKELIAMKEEMIKYKNVITDTQREAGNSFIKQTKDLQDQQVELEKTREKAEKFFKTLNTDVKISGLQGNERALNDYQRIIDSVNKSYKNFISETARVQTNLAEANRVITNIRNNPGMGSSQEMLGEQYQRVNENIRSYVDGVNNFISANNLSEESINNLRNALQNYNNFIEQNVRNNPNGAMGLSPDQIQQMQQLFDVIRQEYGRLTQDLTNGANIASTALKQEADGAANDILNKQEQVKNGFNGMIDEIKMQSISQSIIQLTSSFGQLAFSIQSISSLGSIWNNDDIDAGEKILKTITTLSFVIPGVINGFKAIETALGVQATLEDVRQAKKDVNTAKKIANEKAEQLEITRTLKTETVAHQTKMWMEYQELEAKLAAMKATGNEKSKIAITNMRTAAQKAYNAALAEKNVILNLNQKEEAETIAVEEAQDVVTKKLTLSQNAFNASMLANPAVWVLAGIAAVIGVTVIAWNNYINELKQTAKAEKELAKKEQEKLEIFKEQKKNIDNLVTSYQNLKEQLDNHEIGLAEAQKQTYDLCMQYDLQDLALKTLISDYNKLGNVINEVQSQKNIEVLNQAEKTENQSVTAMRANTKAILEENWSGGNNLYIAGSTWDKQWSQFTTEDDKRKNFNLYNKLNKITGKDIYKERFDSNGINQSYLDLGNEENIKALVLHWEEIQTLLNEGVVNNVDTAKRVKELLNQLFDSENIEIAQNSIKEQIDVSGDEVARVLNEVKTNNKNISYEDWNKKYNETVNKLAEKYQLSFDEISEEALKDLGNNIDNIEFITKKKLESKIENEIKKQGKDITLDDIKAKIDFANLTPEEIQLLLSDEKYVKFIIEIENDSELKDLLDKIQHGTEQEKVNAKAELLQKQSENLAKSISQKGVEKADKITYDDLKAWGFTDEDLINGKSLQEFAHSNAQTQLNDLNVYRKTGLNQASGLFTESIEEIQDKIDKNNDFENNGFQEISNLYNNKLNTFFGRAKEEITRLADIPKAELLDMIEGNKDTGNKTLSSAIKFLKEQGYDTNGVLENLQNPNKYLGLLSTYLQNLSNDEEGFNKARILFSDNIDLNTLSDTDLFFRYLLSDTDIFQNGIKDIFTQFENRFNTNNSLYAAEKSNTEQYNTSITNLETDTLKSQITSFGQLYDLKQKGLIQDKEYNELRDDLYYNTLDLLGIDTDYVELYVKRTGLTKDAALAQIQANKAATTAQKALSDLNKEIDNSSDGLNDNLRKTDAYSTAMNNLKISLKDAFGVDFSEDFIEKHRVEIEAALTGNSEDVEFLKSIFFNNAFDTNSFFEEYNLNTIVDVNDSQLKAVKDWMDQNKDLGVFTVDGKVNEQYVKQLASKAALEGMSLSAINSLLEPFGYTGSYQITYDDIRNYGQTHDFENDADFKATHLITFKKTDVTIDDFNSDLFDKNFYNITGFSDAGTGTKTSSFKEPKTQSDYEALKPDTYAEVNDKLQQNNNQQDEINEKLKDGTLSIQERLDLEKNLQKLQVERINLLTEEQGLLEEDRKKAEDILTKEGVEYNNGIIDRASLNSRLETLNRSVYDKNDKALDLQNIYNNVDSKNTTAKQAAYENWQAAKKDAEATKKEYNDLKEAAEKYSNISLTELPKVTKELDSLITALKGTKLLTEEFINSWETKKIEQNLTKVNNKLQDLQNKLSDIQETFSDEDILEDPDKLLDTLQKENDNYASQIELLKEKGNLLKEQYDLAKENRDRENNDIKTFVSQASVTSFNKNGKPITGTVDFSKYLTFDEDGNITNLDEFYEKINKYSKDTGWTVAEDFINGLEEMVKKSEDFTNNMNAADKEMQSNVKDANKLADLMEATDKVSRKKLLTYATGEIDAGLKQVEKELKVVQREYSRLEKIESRGYDTYEARVANLQHQKELINNQIELQQRKLELQKTEQDLAINNLNLSLQKLGLESQIQVVDGQIVGLSMLYAEIMDKSNDLTETEVSLLEQLIQNVQSYTSLVQQSADAIDNLKFTLEDLDFQLEDEAYKRLEKEMQERLKKFHLSVDLELDLAKAERDWHDYLKRVYEGVNSKDILGQALNKAFAIDHMSANDVGILNGALDTLLGEFNTILVGGESSLYGKDIEALKDDMQKYMNSSMETLNDIQDKVDEIIDAYYSMIDKVNDKLSDQLNLYKQITSIVEHNKNLTGLLYGDDEYEAFDRFYEQQEKNNLAQAAFARQTVDFWRQQMDSAKVGSEEWEKFKANWISAVNDLNSIVEDSVQNIIDRYSNAVEETFNNLEKSLSNGLGLEKLKEQWDLQNREADRYLDTVNAAYEVDKLKNKFVNTINDTTSLKNQEALRKVMDEQLGILQKKEKISKYDIERANALYDIEVKRQALEEAKNNRTTMRLRRDAEGNYRYQYVADEDKIAEAQQALADAQNSLYNLDKDRVRETQEEVYNITKEFLDKRKELQEEYRLADENEKQAVLDRMTQMEAQYNETIRLLTQDNEDARQNLQESTFDNLVNLTDMTIDELTQMGEEEKDILMTSIVPNWNDGIQQMINTIAAEGGLVPACSDAFAHLDQLTIDYQESLNKLQEVADVDFSKIRDEGLDPTIDKTQELIEQNSELIDAYEDQMETLKNLADEVSDLADRYKELEDRIKAVMEALGKSVTVTNEDLKKTTAEVESKENKTGVNNTEKNNKDNSKNKFTDPAMSLIKFGLDVAKQTSKLDSSWHQGGGIGWLLAEDNNGNDYYEERKFTKVKEEGNTRQFKDDQGYIEEERNIIWDPSSLIKDYKIIKRYDTGGYTGDWGDSSGRLAMLHSKELVLNAQDTENILSAVNIVREVGSVLSTIERTMGAYIPTILSAIVPSAVSGDSLEQNVHIDAHFPNVTQSSEIEDAFNNLVNLASQRALRNNR